MSDLEYDVLDELYFLIHFKELIANLGLSDDEIAPILSKMHRKGWLRCFTEPNEELEPKDIDLEINFRSYYYMATKVGLKAHTTS